MNARTLIKILVAATALTAGIIGVGSIRTPTGPATGKTLDAPATYTPQPATDTIRIATFNLHASRGKSGREDLTLSSKTAEGFDLVGLEEVYDTLRPGTPPQVAILGQSLSEPWLFAPTERQYWADRFGNGVITRLPINSWQRTALPAPNEHSRRNVLLLKSPTPRGTITFLITHITRSSDQDEQLQFITKLFLDQPTPAILMGDLNATSQEPALKDLLARPDIGNPLDEKLPEHAGQHIDWILTRGTQTRAAGLRDLGASDHPLAWAELTLLPPPTTGPTPTSSPSTPPANP